MTLNEMPLSLPRQAGLCVRREREAQGLTQRQLAQKSHVSERTIISLELGDATGIRLDKLLSVLHALGIELFARKRRTQESEESHQAGSNDTSSAQAFVAPLPEKAAPRICTVPPPPEGDATETGPAKQAAVPSFGSPMQDRLTAQSKTEGSPSRQDAAARTGTCEYEAMLHDFLARTMSASPASTRKEADDGKRR